jgi:Uma2 family endonuclease
MNYLAEVPVSARHAVWTETEYTAMENESSVKHEYLDGEVTAMPGGSPRHNRVVARSFLALSAAKQTCETLVSNVRIYAPAARFYTYPDGGLVCGKWRIHDDGMCLLNPVLLVEVLSPSTRDYDLGLKREHYQRIPTLRHLLLIEPEFPWLRHVSRDQAGTWREQDHTTGVLALPDLGLSISIPELYPAD